MDIKSLHRAGHSIRAIAQMTGRSRNTVRSILREAAPQPFQTPERASKLDPFKPYLKEACKEGRLPAPRLLADIQAMGFTGSIDTLQRYLRTLSDEQVRAGKMTVRFETPPGKQAQVDWFEVARLDDGSKVYAFVMVLGFSRALFVAFTQSMRLEELIRCHQAAFEYFGGMPQEILYDNMAQVRLPGSREIHPLMADFAAHYGFAVKTCRVRRPRTKGKVERAGQYLQTSFLNGSTFAGLEDLAARGREWMEKANRRLHATTKQRPIDLLAKEDLTPYASAAPYLLALRHNRKVDSEGYVHLAGCRYSVPPEHVGKRVVVVEVGGGSPSRPGSPGSPPQPSISAISSVVQVRLGGDLIIAEHPRSDRTGAVVSKPEHVSQMWRRSLEGLQRTGTPGKQSLPGQLREREPIPKVTFSDADKVTPRDLSVYEVYASIYEIYEEPLLGSPGSPTITGVATVAVVEAVGTPAVR